MNTEVNEYVVVLNERIIEAKKKNACASNIKKLNQLALMLSSEKLSTFLRNSKVDKSVFTRAIYATEKVVKFAMQALTFDTRYLNENTYAIFRTAINCAKNNVEFTKDDARASISKDIKVNDDKKAFVYRRNLIQDVATIAAQSQTSLDALKSLNIIRENAEKRNIYDVNLDCDITKQLCKNFNIDLNAKQSNEVAKQSNEVAKQSKTKKKAVSLFDNKVIIASA